MGDGETRRWDAEDESAIDTGCLERLDFAYEGGDTVVEYVTREFTSVCPWTGLPDFAELRIRYVPRRHLVELKSLKYYLTSFRNVGILQEHAANRILRDLATLLDPREMTVTMDFAARGGIGTLVEVRWPSRPEENPPSPRSPWPGTTNPSV